MKELWRKAFMLARVSGPKMGHRPADFQRFAEALGVPPITALRALRAAQDRRASDVLSVRIQTRRHWKWRGPVTLAEYHAKINRAHMFGGSAHG